MREADTTARTRAELEDLRRRLTEAEETILAIKTGGVDAVVVSGPGGERVYTLESAEHPYRAFVEAMNEGVATLSSDGTILFCNRRLATLTGTPFETLIGSSIFGCFSPALRPAAQAAFEQARGTPTVVDLAFGQTDAESRPVQVSMTALPLLVSENASICMVVLDLAEHRKSERAKALLATGFEQSVDSVAVLDRQGNISSVNSAFERLNHTTAAQVIGKPYVDFLVGCGVAQEEEQAISEAIERGRSWTGHSQCRMSGLAEEAVFAVTVVPVRGEGGDVIAYIAWGRDITRKILTEKDTIQRQKLEALGLLAGGIAHDLNNILMPLMASIELALLRISVSSPLREHLEMSLQAAKLGREVVKRILKFSATQPVDYRVTRLDLLVRESVALLRSALPGNVTIHEDIPDCPIAVRAEDSQMHEVIMNLVHNAVHAMRERGGVLTVSLAVVDVDGERREDPVQLAVGRYLRLTVADTGHGMSSATVERIYDPFFTTKSPDEGTGLGLAIVRGIIEGHSGAITVHSEVGVGTVFVIYLPCVDAEGTPEPALFEPPAHGSERILFVDDEAMVRKTGERLLAQLGYRVQAVSDGAAALALFEADPSAFDLVITDQRMPLLSGSDLAMKMLAIRPSLPIILCTGFSADINARQAKAMGIREFLLKPYSIQDLAISLRRALCSAPLRPA